MTQRNVKRISRKLSSEEKAKYAEMARSIEQEFPPGKKVELCDDCETHLKTLGEYFDLRSVVRQLRTARESQGLSLTDIQERTGIDRSAISRLENDENGNPTINTLTRYAEAVGRRIVVTVVHGSA